MKVAVVGATGLVGKTMIQLLQERNFPVTELIPVASERSAGQQVMFKDKSYRVITCGEALLKCPQLALFSAGGTTSLEWAPQFAAVGATVIDNSSAWRMDDQCPLIVPEINADVLNARHKIIANPNCSTIQMVIALNPLHLKYRIRRIVVSTYQSVSGTGKKAVDQLMNERSGQQGVMAYPYPIDLNVLPQVDQFTDNGYTKEEMKMVNETRKILRSPEIQITATTVRVPVIGGHSESVNVEFLNDFNIKEVFEMLQSAPGVSLWDDLNSLKYPMPLYAQGSDSVFVGRIRRDESQERTLNLWVVADNLRKGAATNAIQIAEYLITHQLI